MHQHGDGWRHGFDPAPPNPICPGAFRRKGSKLGKEVKLREGAVHRNKYIRVTYDLKHLAHKEIANKIDRENRRFVPFR